MDTIDSTVAQDEDACIYCGKHEAEHAPPAPMIVGPTQTPGDGRLCPVPGVTSQYFSPWRDILHRGPSGRDRFYLHWILHAYETLNRAGWEDGYSHEELSSELLHVLCNSGLHPTERKGEWMKLARDKMGRTPPKL